MKPLVPLLLLPLAACGANESPAPFDHGTIRITSDGHTWTLVSSTELPFEVYEGPGLRITGPFSMRTVATDTTHVGTLDGRAMHVVDGRVRVGELDFGPIAPGGTIEVKADGLHVDGEHRGTLPRSGE